MRPARPDRALAKHGRTSSSKGSRVDSAGPTIMRSILSMTCARSLRLAAPPCRDVGQQQFLAEQRARELWQEGEEGASLEDA